MAASSRVSNAFAKAMLDDLNALLGGAALLKIRTGSAPTNCEDAATGTLLATCAMSATPFGAAADSTDDATITANAISNDTSADATNTAGYFRLEHSDGTCHVQGNIGTADACLIMPTTSIVAGQPISISSLTIRLPEVGT